MVIVTIESDDNGTNMEPGGHSKLVADILVGLMVNFADVRAVPELD